MESSEDLVGGVIAPATEGKADVDASSSPVELRSLSATEVFRKRFDGNADFQAMAAAEKWLADNGYSVGRNQGASPRGVMLGDYDIAKWRNLHRRDIAKLHGTLTGDSRHGPLLLTLYVAPPSTPQSSTSPAPTMEE